MKKFKTFEEFMKDCIFHKENVVLPNNVTFEKFPYITPTGFDHHMMRIDLLEIYNKKFKE